MHRKWDPGQIWEGQDAYIIGGGPSLQGFDWDLIRGANTIGCNSAFILGSDIVKICLFCDYNWWEKIGSKKLPEYGGVVVASCPRFDDMPTERCPSWVLHMEREEDKNGLSPNKLCFNQNTGAAAINMALILGAKRVFLLGFDMKMDVSNDRPNWHTLRHEPGLPDVYPRFMSFMAYIGRDLPRFFPGAEIINISDDSALKTFPIVTLSEHFGSRGEGVKAACPRRHPTLDPLPVGVKGR